MKRKKTLFSKKEILTLRMLDLAKGTKTAWWLRFYDELLRKNTADIRSYQQARLKALLIHAKNSVPYYKTLFKESSIDLSEIDSVSSLHKLPFLTRDLIRAQGDRMFSDKIIKSKLSRGSSSGTTGIPIDYYSDKGGLSAGIASSYILLSMSGWNIGQRNVHVWGNQTSIERWNTTSSKLKNWLLNQKNIASHQLNDYRRLDVIATEIIKHNPISMDGYPGSVFTLAKHFQSNNLNLPTLKHIITTAENLEDYQESLIEEVFGPVADLYGSGEVLGIASRPVGEKRYYVFDPHVIVETVESGIPGMKDVLLTDLDNYGMPFIRYRIGDMIDELHEPDSESKYPLKWFTKIYGRSSDIIILPNGMKFHPVNIFGGTLFRKFRAITRHKVIWNGKRLTFVFEAKEFRQEEELNNAIYNLVERFQVEYSIQFTEKITPSPNGKFRYMEIVKELEE